MKTTHQITVMGREIAVKSSASVEKVQSVEAYVKGKVQEIGGALKNSDAQLVLTLALLNVTEELFELRSTIESERVFDDRLQRLMSKLEQV